MQTPNEEKSATINTLSRVTDDEHISLENDLENDDVSTFLRPSTLINSAPEEIRKVALEWELDMITNPQPASISVLVTPPSSQSSWVPRIEHMTLQKAVDIVCGRTPAKDVREMRVAAQVREAALLAYEELKQYPHRGESPTHVIAAKLRGAQAADRRRILIAADDARDVLGWQLTNHPCTEEFIVTLIVAQNFRCISCKRVMLFFRFPYLHPAQFTIGRVFNRHQHVPANVVIVCLACNVAGRELKGLVSEIGNECVEMCHKWLEMRQVARNPLLLTRGVYKKGNEAFDELLKHVKTNEPSTDSDVFAPLHAIHVKSQNITDRRVHKRLQTIRRTSRSDIISNTKGDQKLLKAGDFDNSKSYEKQHYTF